MGNPANMFPVLHNDGILNYFEAIFLTCFIFGCLGALCLGFLYLKDPEGFKKAQIEGKRRQEAEAAWEETLLVKKEEFIKNYKSD